MTKKKKSSAHNTPLAKDLKALARDLAKEVVQGRSSTETLADLALFSSREDTALTLIDIFVQEGNKKKSNDGLMNSYHLMMSEFFANIGYREEDDPFKQKLVPAIENKLIDLLNAEKAEPVLVMMILHHFREARLEISPDLMQMMENSLANQVGEREAFITSDKISDGPLLEMLEHVEGNVFEFANMFLDNAEATPIIVTEKIIRLGLFSDEEKIREGVLSCLLSNNPDIRRTFLDLLGMAIDQGKITSVMLRRLIAMRNWIPEDERPELDAAIRKSKQKKIECASWPKVTNIREIWTSGFDGSGAQSIFIVAKEGRRHAVANILLKQGKGVRDAFVMHNATLAQVREFLKHVKTELYLIENSMEYVQTAIANFLSLNQVSGEFPRYALMDVAEVIGVSDLNPSNKTTQTLIEELCQEIPLKIDDTLIGKALQFSEDWSDAYFEIAQSWFIEGADVDKITTSKVKQATKVNQMLKGPLEKRRVWWAEFFVHMAMTVRHEEITDSDYDSEQGSDWMDFTLVARELMSDRPLKDIPIMVNIAARSATPYQDFSIFDDLF